MGHAQTAALTYYDYFARGDFPAASALFADDCTVITPSGALDRAAHEGMGRAFKAAFPDSHMEVVRAVELGDEVYIGGYFKGTHTGDLAGPGGTIPASGNTLSVPFADYFRVVEGKIVAQESVFDQLALLGQIGALPPS